MRKGGREGGKEGEEGRREGEGGRVGWRKEGSKGGRREGM